MSRRGSICICGSDEHELYFIPDESEPTSTLVVKSIGRRGVGYVTFFECVQIPADDLYTGVHIDHGSIEIREESGICSPFNRPASVTFENVWNLDEWRLECTRHGDTTTVASSHDESDPVALSAMYSAETGIFRFAVSGFSKYKLCLAGSSSPNGQSSDSKETFSRQQNSAATHSWAPSYERRPQVVYSKSESSPLSDFLVSDLLHNLASAEVYSPDGGPLRFPPDVGDGVSHWRIHFLERLADNSQRTGSDELDGALSESEIDVREASQTPESSTALFDLFFEEYIAACEIKRCNGRIELIPPRGSGKYLEFTAKQLFRVPFDSTEAMHLWIALKLICALWGAGSSAGQAGYKADRPETAQAFLSWLKDVLPHFNSDKQDYHDDMYHSVFQRMAG
ncbi:uncharacterized protein LOC129588094 [Paramacrobiotus metropolitanus]|uniref:uncharacterized protein LOC129588094 n=1 Tax=Paramacrobiotus metropolitanus TaxID=2943436 RepID=UPI00244642E4|nr:uncharacterized protein LOC129588094 [Paramacrobiotus metropolitanus]